MRQLFYRFWNEDGGWILGAEWALITTVLVLGAITGVFITHTISQIEHQKTAAAHLR